MDIVVAFVGMALIVIVAAFVAQPLIVKERVTSVPAESERDRLLAERDRLYAAIRDLDFDFKTAKLLEADYRSMRETYASRGVEILKQLDAIPVRPPDKLRGKRRQAPAIAAERGPKGDDEIERAVQARRQSKARATVQAPADEIEAAILARRQSRPKPETEIQPMEAGQVQTLACPSCGSLADPADRFCAKCGTPLTVEAMH